VFLQGFRSLLTDSQDASYLFNAVLDAVVDHTLPLVQVRAAAVCAFVDGMSCGQQSAQVPLPALRVFSVCGIVLMRSQWCHHC
jgi:hypothetical protein